MSAWMRALPTAVVLSLAPAARAHSPAAPGELPLDTESMLDDLAANDLRLRAARDVNGVVFRLDFERPGCRFRVKWKPLGPRGSEVQDGFDGNNAPRCEVAAWRMSRLLFGTKTTEHHLVAPVLVRAFHRDVPCQRACAGLPRLPGLAREATFPELNDHIVLAAVTWWIDGVVTLARFHGGLWDPRRFARDRAYRRSFSDLCLFLYLIHHGDANYADNFLTKKPGRDRIYSIDNGRAFDGVPYYTEKADPDWRPFAQLAPQRLVAPAFSAQTLARLSALDRTTLERELRVVAAVDLQSGRTVREPAAMAGLLHRATRHGRGVYTVVADGTPWVLLGIGEPGITDLQARAAALSGRLQQFDEVRERNDADAGRRSPDRTPRPRAPAPR